MPFLDALDDVGIRYVLRPLSLLSRIHLLNTFDDIGIHLVFRPLRYLHRFAAFLLDSELYPIITYADVMGLMADESLVSSMSGCSMSLTSGSVSGNTVSGSTTRGSGSSTGKRSRAGSSTLAGTRSARSAASAGKGRSNGHA